MAEMKALDLSFQGKKTVCKSDLRLLRYGQFCVFCPQRGWSKGNRWLGTQGWNVHCWQFTHTQSIAFFECVWVLWSTLKASNAFDVTYTGNSLLSSDAFGCFEVLWRSKTHLKWNTHTIMAFIECVWVLWSTLKHPNAFDVTDTHNSLLSSNAFGCFKVLRSTQMHSKNITANIHIFIDTYSLSLCWCCPCGTP